MRSAWAIAMKEILQNRRDPLAALFTLVLPVVFTVFLGLLIPSAGEEGSRLPVALVDADGSPTAEQLVTKLTQAPLLELQPRTSTEAEQAVQDQRVAAALIIPKGFGAAVETGGPATLTFVRILTSSGAQSVLQAIQTVLAETNIATLASQAAAEQVALETGRPTNEAPLDSARSLVDAALAAPAITVQVTDAAGSTTLQVGGFDQASTGALVNWVLFSLIGITANVVWERRQGLLRRLSVAGIKAREIIGGKMLAMVMLTFGQQLLLVLLGQFAFGVDYFSNPSALLVTMISLSMLAAVLGLLIVSLFRSEGAVIATTVITAQLLAALGGAWFPLEITGAGFARVARVLPSAWVMDSLHGITLQNWGVADVLRPMGIVWMWIVGILVIAIWRFRPNRS